MSAGQRGRCRAASRPKKVKPFVSIALSELLAMSTAELDYFSGLAGEKKREWLSLWRSVREDVAA